ncbi:MAG TPA: hypothetical protein VL916_17480, partial [Ilumatobacteraceae bacterium]|nr:hypothetical protein [Ilumatobacteraceae bacterium]
DVKQAGTQTANINATGKDASAYRIDLSGALGASIYFRNLDDVVIATGKGNDTFEIRATHVGETVLDTGNGNDNIDVFSTNGNTTVLAGAGTDRVRVGGLVYSTSDLNGDTFPDIRPGIHVLDTIQRILVVSDAESLIGDDNADDTAVPGSGATGDVTVVSGNSMTGADMGEEEEVQQITLDADAGKFKLEFGTARTDFIDMVTFPADGSHTQMPTADTVRRALEALLGVDVGDVEVTLDLNTYTIRFRNNLAGLNVAQLSIVESTLTKVGVAMSTVGRVRTVRDGSSTGGPFNWNEHQIVSVVGAFRLWFRGSTGDLPANATAQQVETALLALPDLDFGDVSVTKLRDGVFGIDFRGQYAGQQVELLQVLNTSGGPHTQARVETRIDGIEYWGVNTLRLDMGPVVDTLIVTSTDDETTSATIDTHAGADFVVIEKVDAQTNLTITVGSPAETDLDTVVVRGTDSTVDGVDGTVAINGGGPDYHYGNPNRDRLFVFDEGETSDNTGKLDRVAPL